jgi:hypothetical protein
MTTLALDQARLIEECASAITGSNLNVGVVSQLNIMKGEVVGAAIKCTVVPKAQDQGRIIRSLAILAEHVAEEAGYGRVTITIMEGEVTAFTAEASHSFKNGSAKK